MPNGFKLVLILCVTGAALYLLSNRRDSSGTAFSYSTSWEGSLDEARASRKPILLYFGGSW